jgi:hypothetical protein
MSGPESLISGNLNGTRTQHCVQRLMVELLSSNEHGRGLPCQPKVFWSFCLLA